MPDKVSRHKALCDELNELYTRKNQFPKLHFLTVILVSIIRYRVLNIRVRSAILINTFMKREVDHENCKSGG